MRQGRAPRTSKLSHRMTIRSASSVLQRLLSRDFVLRRQTPSSASNIRFIIKLQKPVDPHIVLSLKKEKHFVRNRQFLPKNPQSLSPNHRGFSPRLSTIESPPATAFHSFGSQPCRRVSAPRDLSGSSWFVRAPVPRGILIVWAQPLVGLKCSLACAL